MHGKAIMLLTWEKIADSFLSISVGKEYGAGPHYWTTFYYYRGLMIDTGCPDTAQEAGNFIEEMKRAPWLICRGMVIQTT